MNPVHQTLFNHTFPYGGGNCLQACVASLFDKPLEAVPHFMLFGDTYWYEALRVYLKSIGYDLSGWWEGEPPHDGQYYLVSMSVGKTDHNHACIYKDGQVVHDPHPTIKGGLDHCEGYYSIKPLSQL